MIVKIFFHRAMGEKMVCITIPKDQRTAAGCQLPSYHLVRMMKITFPDTRPL